MELLELMKYRRSIRKYQDRQIPKTDLEKIIEAGTYAPNAGGGQRSMVVGALCGCPKRAKGGLAAKKAAIASGGCVGMENRARWGHVSCSRCLRF